MARIPLAQIRVKEPCPVPWDDMKGTDTSRHCSFCNLNVHNLSAMTEDAAQRLICETGGRLCVAFYPNADGSPQTLEYRPQKPPRWGWRFATLLGGVGAALAGCVAYVTREKPPAVVAPIPGQPVFVGPMVAGLIALPTTRPTTVVGDVSLTPSDGAVCDDPVRPGRE